MRAILVLCVLLLGCAAKEDVAAQLVACSVAGNPDAAISACTALLRPGRLGVADTATTHQHRGEAFLRRQQFALADADFEAALAARPDMVEAARGRCLANVSLGRGERGTELCSTALRLVPKDVSVLNNRGAAWLMRDLPEQARADFDAALAEQPTLAQALNNRCSANLRLARLAEALADCDRALQIIPNLLDARINRAVIRIYAGTPADALPDLDAALAANPRHFSAWNNRAVARLQLGEYAKASTDLAEAERLGGPSAGNRYLRGLIAWKSRADLAGRQEMEQALAADPGLRARMARYRLLDL